jgi:hypothetical protein
MVLYRLGTARGTQIYNCLFVIMEADLYYADQLKLLSRMIPSWITSHGRPPP